VLFFCVPWIVLGCGDFDREFGAGGTDKSGSLLNVESISPTYFSETTDGPGQVDVVQGNCATDPLDPIDPEPYSDHFAEVAMTNRPLPNAQVQTASWIYLTRYEIFYTASTQGTGPLLSANVIPVTQTVGIEPCEVGGSCQETSFIAQFVPITEKEELYDYLLDNPAIDQLEYNVHYIFYGENDFGEQVSADGFSSFYAGNYNNCGGG
jgi:hypothetical protein